jgi:hypothetical protein
MKTVKAGDAEGRLAIKDAILARSGIYVYGRDEVLASGLRPPVDRDVYLEYRPASVLVAAKDKFNMVPVPREHPKDDINEHNFHDYASGVTGGPIEVVPLDNGEVGLRGKIAFFTKDAFDYYNSGNKETSASLTKRVVYTEDRDSAGYDWIVRDISSVNHVCITGAGRGGEAVRVLDSAFLARKYDGGMGMAKMRSGFLAFLGIGKQKDSGFKFSAALMDSVSKVHSLDEAGLEKEIGGVMGHVTALGDSEERDLLVGAVADCFKHPVEVIAQRDAVAKKIDELYEKCKALDSDAVKRLLGSASEETKPEGEKGGGTGEAALKDAGDVNALIDAAVDKAVSKTLGSLDSKIDAAVKKTLGLGADGSPGGDARHADSAGTDSVTQEDASFLVRGVFGNR